MYIYSSFSADTLLVHKFNVLHILLSVPAVLVTCFFVVFATVVVVVVVVVLLGNPSGLSWPNNRDSEIFLQILPESVQRRS